MVAEGISTALFLTKFKMRKDSCQDKEQGQELFSTTESSRMTDTGAVYYAFFIRLIVMYFNEQQNQALAIFTEEKSYIICLQHFHSYLSPVYF